MESTGINLTLQKSQGTIQEAGISCPVLTQHCGQERNQVPCSHLQVSLWVCIHS